MLFVALSLAAGVYVPVNSFPSCSALNTMGYGASATLFVVVFICPVIATPADTSSSNVMTIVADFEGLIRSPSLNPVADTLTIFGPVSSAWIATPLGSVVASSPVMKPSLMVNVSFVPPKLFFASSVTPSFILISSASELAKLILSMSLDVKKDPEPPSIFHANFDQSILSAVKFVDDMRSRS